MTSTKGLSPEKTACRVLIADDSDLARMLLRSLLEAAGMEVIGEAVNGQEAVLKTRQLRPDLVTMDLHMPVMDGLEAIETIMHDKALPILVVSSQADAAKACQALEAGALEVMAKPDYTPEQARHFVDRVRLLAGVPVITRYRRQTRPSIPLPSSTGPSTGPSTGLNAGSDERRAFAPEISAAVPRGHLLRPARVVALAASTGGPQALAQLLPRLDADFPAPILLAQHISDGFAEGMANWLDRLCLLSVKLAEEGEAVRPGWVYVSPSERHLTLTPHYTLALLERQQGDLYRPSCDHLFRSLASVCKKAALGVIMTGMGHDGAQGLLEIRQAGGQTLAQDEASSVIYGMNQEAVRLGAVERQVPLSQLPEALCRLLKQPVMT